MPPPALSVIVPAYNEARCLPDTLEHITRALARAARPSELLVVDNASTDATRSIAEAFGATVVTEPVHNIARVRNAGAARASGGVLVFLDADTRVPEALLQRILAVLTDERCQGGAVAVAYDRPRRRWMRVYLQGWRFWAKVFNMAQGAAQFCRRSTFQAAGGYDETIFVGEDIEFYWRLSRLARRQGGYLAFIQQPAVVTSSRRFDQMSLGRTLLLTHPVFIRMAWRKPGFWKDWYERAVR